MFTVCALAGVLGVAFSACDDSSSAGDDDNNVILSGDSREESSDSRSNDKDEAISSSGKVTDKDSEPAEVSSSSVESSSSIGDVSKSYVETKVMPSGTFDCSKYNCFTTENLNQEFLEAGKYGEILDERDGQVYKTIQIGTQTWMAENLNYDPGQGGSGSSAYDWSWCYDDDPSNCAKYGRLYTWAAAMDSATTGCGDRKYSAVTGRGVQGVCPNGWLLPDTAEWRALFAAVAEDLDTAGTALKTTSGWYDDGNGTDAFGFSALPSGSRSYYDGNFNNAGNYASFWSSSEFMGDSAYSLYLNYADASAARGLSVKNFAFAVRCVKDSE